MIDRLTNLLSTAIRILLIGYPIRTSLGVIVGVAINAIIKIFSPLFARLSFLIDLSKIQAWEYIILGVAVLHIQTIKLYLFKKGSLLGDNEEKALEIIKQAKDKGTPDWQIQKMYIGLCEKVLENVQLKQTTKQEIEDYLKPDISKE